VNAGAPGAAAPAAGGAAVRVLDIVDALDADEDRPRLADLPRRFDPAEFELSFAVLDGARDAPAAAIARLGGRVHHIDGGPRLGPAFLRLVRRVRPDVVQASSARSQGALLMLARLAGVRRRVAVLRLERAGPRHSRLVASSGVAAAARRALDRRLVDAAATDLVATSDAAMRTLWRADWRMDPRCRVIYSGLEVEPYGVAIAARIGGSERDADARAGSGPGRRGTGPRRRPGGPSGSAGGNGPSGLGAAVVILHVGGDGEAGNRARALRILAAVRNRGVDARLWLVGRVADGERAALGELAAGLGISGQVEILGERADLSRLIVAASLVLVTAAREGAPNAVLEACAVATPVLSSDLADVAEIARLLPGVTMLPLAAADEAWADTARALTASRPTRDERRAALRAFVHSPFTIEHWQREITAVWK
jgi:glycosyltransferase involved in cell wall biosynthesis